jgi:hypothetical protein
MSYDMEQFNERYLHSAEAQKVESSHGLLLL